MNGLGPPSLQQPQLVSVNVGTPRTVEWHGRSVTTAIWKSPVTGRVPLRGVNLAGDDQADRRVHGGPDKAIYAYSAEDYGWWEHELGQPLAPGTFGENLTTRGLDLGAAVVGERWQLGTAALVVAQPRFPCFKLGLRMGDAAFVDRFDRARRSGAYLRIVEEGDVGAGDMITVIASPAHGLTIADIVEVNAAPTEKGLRRLVDVDEVPENLRTWAMRTLARRDADSNQHGPSG